MCIIKVTDRVLKGRGRWFQERFILAKSNSGMYIVSRPIMRRFIVRSELRARVLTLRVPIGYVVKSTDRFSLKLRQRFVVSTPVTWLRDSLCAGMMALLRR
ncbi:hypothetical protein BGZ89_006444 [Linnemannia elongata]|nr:hypothetical protein BGZ89_006444 [Linnemannia elongata]